MKKTMIALALAVAIPAAFAASGERGPSDDRRGPHLDRMSVILDLSEEQRAQLEGVFEDHRAQRDAMREQMRARMAQVLSPDQIAKMEAMRELRKERRGHRRGYGHGDRHGYGGGHGRGGDCERAALTESQ